RRRVAHGQRYWVGLDRLVKALYAQDDRVAVRQLPDRDETFRCSRRVARAVVAALDRQLESEHLSRDVSLPLVDDRDQGLRQNDDQADPVCDLQTGLSSAALHKAD